MLSHNGLTVVAPHEFGSLREQFSYMKNADVLVSVESSAALNHLASPKKKNRLSVNIAGSRQFLKTYLIGSAMAGRFSPQVTEIVIGKPVSSGWHIINHCLRSILQQYFEFC